jgi:tetratricopeptide (TPR) repeat protein
MYRQNMRDKGIAWYLRHKKLYSTHFGTNYWGGNYFLLEPVQPQLALEAFEKALEMAPDDTAFHETLFYRGLAKEMMRAFESAAVDLRNCHKFDPDNTNVLILLASLEDELGNKDRGKELLQKVIQIQPDNVIALANIGFGLQKDSAWEASNTFYNRVLELDPNQPLGYSNRGYNRMMLGDLKGAMKDIKKSIELFPENSWAYRNQGLIYLRMKKKKEACASFEEGLRRGFTERYGPELEQLHKEHCR